MRPSVGRPTLRRLDDLFAFMSSLGRSGMRMISRYGLGAVLTWRSRIYRLSLFIILLFHSL